MRRLQKLFAIVTAWFVTQWYVNWQYLMFHHRFDGNFTFLKKQLLKWISIQKKFPTSNLDEWNSNNNHPLGLRNMHLYVLVFDMGNLETFQYCRSMREQILSSFNHRNFSIIVVGNKFDLIADSPNYSQVNENWRKVKICNWKWYWLLNLGAEGYFDTR